MFSERSLDAFTKELSSAAPVPGGGGASALVGALGAALGSMVGNLTVGKKKYAQFEPEIREVMEKLEAQRQELLRLIEADADGFAPLQKAYAIPKEDPCRTMAMEEALSLACQAPLQMLDSIGKVTELLPVLAEKGSVLAVSDVGVAAECCCAAAKGAGLNVLINAGMMRDRELGDRLKAETLISMTRVEELSREVYDRVLEKL